MEFKKGDKVLFIGIPSEGTNKRYGKKLSKDKVYTVSKGNHFVPGTTKKVITIEGFEPCCWYSYTFKKIDTSFIEELEIAVINQNLILSL